MRLYPCASPCRLQAIAAAVALLSVPWQATAQTYYTWTGSVAPQPADATNPVFNAGGPLTVGSGAAGSFSALAGAQLDADLLDIGAGGGNGNVAVSGNATPGSAIVQLGGAGQSRVQVGNWGTGSMTVSAGALVDATSNPACGGTSCGVIVGNAAGANGTLTITGAGSELSSIKWFLVANSAAVSGWGTPGGRADGVVDVLNGGTLNTQPALVGYYNRQAANLGTESAYGTVNINGAGSQWLVGPNALDGLDAGVGIGVKSHNDARATADGQVNIANGGKLHIDGGGTHAGYLNLGTSGGSGALTVSGKGSSVEVLGVNAGINAGRSGSGAQGSFSVLAGASAESLYLSVGRDGASGTVVLDGRSADNSVASTLRLVGIGTNSAPGANGPAFANIGWNGGTGQATVSNGAQWLISDGGINGSTVANSPGVGLGRGAGSSGSLTLTGAGSKLEIVSSSINPAPGAGDNYNPFFAVGFDNAATSSGTLRIDSGAKLVMTGNAVSTAANGRSTSLNIGGRNGTAATGTATVTGAGSEILMSGSDPTINVGRMDGSTGILHVLDQAQVSATSLAVGVGTSGAAPGAIKAQGTVNIDHASIVLGGVNNAGQVGAGVTIGRGTNGVGLLNLSNGAQLQINPAALNGGMSVGGDEFLGGGNGTVNLSGASSIVFGGSLSGNGMHIGRSGNGVVNAGGASIINLGVAGDLTLAGVPLAGQSTGTGALNVSGGSKVSADRINIGGNNDTTGSLGGTGTATITGAGSELTASGAIGFIGVGRNAIGNLSVTNQGQVSGIAMSVGRGTAGDGTLVVDGASLSLSGQQTAGNLAGANLAIGLGGGTGNAELKNGSTLVIDNTGSQGAHLVLGGSSTYPQGQGRLELSGNSRIDILGAAAATPGALGGAALTVGGSGGASGTLVLSGASTINVGSGTAGANGAPPVNFQGDGAVYVGRQAGSSGVLDMSGGSTLNAGFVGIGVSAAGTGKTLGTAGGIGTVVLGRNNSEGSIVAPRFELGAGSTLTGSGTIDAGPTGEVVIGGTIAPGNSPGRIRIRCDITMLFGSLLILEIDQNGASFDIDQLIIGTSSTFDLTQMQIIFSFLGDTDPLAFANSADGFNLDRFLRAGDSDEHTAGLSSLFAPGQDWGDIVNTTFAFQSDAYDVSQVRFDPVTGEVVIAATAVPEPATLALLAAALFALACQRRRAAGARRH
ncbi:MAG TPA: PEP-CTERM sorting domain-containing protein [Rubrivivax sp.]|nr:PEP-CTERM sorting domain-containing protein [Rubrivivax sp.]